MLVLATCVFFSSCSDNEYKIAEQNVKDYFSSNYLEDGKIVEEMYSKLYVFRPTNEKELQEIFLKSIETKSLGEKGQAISKNLTSGPSGISIRLITGGCTRSVIEDIIRNDIEYRDSKYATAEYIMIALFRIRNTREIEEMIGFCFSLTPQFNVLDAYNIPKEDIDYLYLRTIGPNPDCITGAVDCEYNYLMVEYNKYVEALEDSAYYLGIDGQYEYLKDLNGLFGYEKYKITNNKELAVRNCVERLDKLADRIELRDKASDNIKKFE